MEQIAGLYKTNVEDIQQQLSIAIDKLSPDAQRMMRGEFVYQVARPDADGFFMMKVPRNQKLKLSFERDPDFVPLTIELKFDHGVFHDIGWITMYQR